MAAITRRKGLPMKKLVLLLFVSVSVVAAQEWEKSEFHDDLHNVSGVRFYLAAKEPAGGAIEVICSAGKLKTAWLLTDKVADAQIPYSSNGFLDGKLEQLVEVEYRRGDERKPHKLRLPVSKDLHGVLLQQPLPSGTQIFLHGDQPRGSDRGLENLLYGPMGFGGGEWHRNKKSNNWARKLVVGVSAYADSDSVFTFNVPDPSDVRESCGIK